MKVVYCLSCFLLVCSSMNTVHANTNNSLSTTLIEYTTKTKPTVKPKSQDLTPLTLTLSPEGRGNNVGSKPKSSYQKYAAIYFIAHDSEIRNTKPETLKATCPDGYKYYHGYCKKNCANGYQLTASQISSRKGRYDSEPCNSEIRYAYISCNLGWKLNSSTRNCDEVSCEGYPLNSPSICASSDYKKCGEYYRYKCTSCPEGYELELSGGGQICIEKPCDRQVYPYSQEPSASAGPVIFCKDSTGTHWGYTKCNDGWYASGAQCFENTCDGYTSTNYTINKCLAVSSCQKGEKAVYKCDTCQKGYQIGNNGGSCDIIICPVGSVNVFTHWCDERWKCLMPGGE